MKATTKRMLYRGSDGLNARYEIQPTGNAREIALRLYDVVGGDSLVFLTPARLRRLVSDLQAQMGAVLELSAAKIARRPRG